MADEDGTTLSADAGSDAATEATADASTPAVAAEPAAAADTATDSTEETGAPEAYTDFTLPEGMELDKAAMEAFLPVAKELNLTQDQAQKLVGLQTAQVAAQAEAQADQWEQTNDEWREAAKADPEFGGPNLQTSLGHVKTFLDKFATTEFREMLDSSGMGNRVEALRMFASVGKAMGEDKITTGLANSGAGERDVGKLFYGDTTPGAVV